MYEPRHGPPDLTRLDHSGQRGRSSRTCTGQPDPKERRPLARRDDSLCVRPHRSRILIDRSRLAELVAEHNVGVDDQQTYALKRLDEDYFEAL